MAETPKRRIGILTSGGDAQGMKDSEGNNIFIEDYINAGSKYIIAFNNSSVTTEPATVPMSAGALTGGQDGMPQDGDIQDGYETYFSNPEEIEINYLIGGRHTTVALASAILAVAQQRADCFAILDCIKTDMVGVSDIATQVANVVDYRKNELNANTSFGALYANWLYIYDKYNDKYRWIPSGGHVAGVYAYTADTTDAWWAPAGLNRGIFRSVIKVAMNPSKAYRDAMYKEQVNPIVSFPGQGIVVWGQKTLQTKPSAFDRVNVRLLFLYMEKAVARAAKYIVFEPNDNLTRATFLNMVNPFMEDIKGRRGVYDYLVDVSDKVNTPERIDRNEFWAEIYVKPTRAAEFIVIRFTATKTGVDFAELQ
jgi:phage tail sheath protein FI